MLNYHITTEAEKIDRAGAALCSSFQKRGFGLTNPQNHFYSFYDGAELIGFMSLREEASARRFIRRRPSETAFSITW